MENKKERKGFWASLFALKPCACSAQLKEMEENPAKKAEIKEEQKKLEEQTIIALAANRLDKPKENNIIKCECSCKC